MTGLILLFPRLLLVAAPILLVFGVDFGEHWMLFLTYSLVFSIYAVFALRDLGANYSLRAPFLYSGLWNDARIVVWLATGTLIAVEIGALAVASSSATIDLTWIALVILNPQRLFVWTIGPVMVGFSRGILG